MAQKNKIVVKHRRYREGKTNYRKRLNLLKSGKPIVVVRKSVNFVIVQIVKYDEAGDRILYSEKSSSLEKFGWNYKKNNLPACYLTGLLIGSKAKKDIKEAVANIGLYPSTKGSRLYAVLKGINDAGVKVNVSEDVLPDEKRIRGEHIKSYAEDLRSKDKAAYDKIFSYYIKKKIDAEKITQIFDETKDKIIKQKSE
ncbi:MAG: 50S ribosomal protein L18 [Candidatus Woesearchaeota archaeon]